MPLDLGFRELRQRRPVGPTAMSAPQSPGAFKTPGEIGSTPAISSAPWRCASRAISAASASITPI